MKKLTIIISLLLGWQTSRAQLVINEFMQSNIDCIMDDLNDFPDSWVELYNAGDSPLQLVNYKLGTKEDGSDAWQLGNVKIGAKEYVLVYCDKVGKDMHTSFRLESGKGCEIYLFEGSTIIDKTSGAISSLHRLRQQTLAIYVVVTIYWANQCLANRAKW